MGGVVGGVLGGALETWSGYRATGEIISIDSTLKSTALSALGGSLAGAVGGTSIGVARAADIAIFGNQQQHCAEGDDIL